jgi:catechol 2,3-dioxygenase-like lactoylglutathione lyase family enzyme
MTVKRIVANIATAHVERAKAFYGDILGLDLVMDHGWILTFAGAGPVRPQISFASEGGSGRPVPDISIEVDDLEEVHRLMVEKKLPIDFGPVTEPWGVRRFFVRDPFDRLINILTHA